MVYLSVYNGLFSAKNLLILVLTVSACFNCPPEQPDVSARACGPSPWWLAGAAARSLLRLRLLCAPSFQRGPWGRVQGSLLHAPAGAMQFLAPHDGTLELSAHSDWYGKVFLVTLILFSLIASEMKHLFVCFLLFSFLWITCSPLLSSTHFYGFRAFGVFLFW